MNKCHFVGVLVRDPEVRMTPGGAKKVRFTLKVTRRYKRRDGETAHEHAFPKLEAWDTAADFIEQNYRAGDVMVADAYVRTESWEDKQTGQKRYETVFRVVEFDKPPQGSGEQDGVDFEKAPRSGSKKQDGEPQTGGKKRDEPASPQKDDPEDIPFG